MRGLKVPKKAGEEVRHILVEKGLLLPEYKIKRDDAFLYFPVKKGIPGYDTMECVFEKRKEHPESIKKFGLSSFDIVGDIAIVNTIHTVVEKMSEVQGEFRVRRFRHLGGDKKSETIHSEHGLKFHVDINTVYFNSRLSTERLRIAQTVQRGEVITDMFCGVGPFPLMISKFSQAEKIYAIDFNPRAIEFLKENITINKIKNVIPILGDAKEEVPKIGRVNRIIMNLPHSAFDFLPVALQYGDLIHYYTITADMQGEVERVKALNVNVPLTIRGYKTVKTYSPDMEMYRIDISTVTSE
jgi:tRNA (guanine37-N1)-methyltransferase